MQLHRHGVLTLVQSGKGGGVDDLKILLHGVPARNVSAVAAVGIAALGIESCGPNAVEIEDRGIVILDMSDELGHLRELIRSERHRRAEVVGGIVGRITGAPGEIGHRTIVQTAALGAEGAFGGIPAVAEIGGSPACADIALGSRIARRVRIIVQISPDGRVVNLSGCLCVFR